MHLSVAFYKHPCWGVTFHQVSLYHTRLRFGERWFDSDLLVYSEFVRLVAVDSVRLSVSSCSASTCGTASTTHCRPSKSTCAEHPLVRSPAMILREIALTMCFSPM